MRDPKSMAEEVRAAFGVVAELVEGPLREAVVGARRIGQALERASAAALEQGGARPEVLCGTCNNRRKVGAPGYEIDCPVCRPAERIR